VRAYTAAEIAQGAKSGQWAALNQRNGASLNSSSASSSGASSSGASTFPTRGSAEAVTSPTAVRLESVLPSRQMVATDLGPMRIQRPENWQVTLPEQKGGFVTIAPQQGVTNSGVGYGVLLNGVPPSGQRVSIEDMTGQILQQIQQNNQLEQLTNPKPIMVGGIEGRSTVLQSPSQFPDANGQPQKEKDWLVTLQRSDGSVIYMIFVAPQSDFAQFQPAFEAMLKSAQFK